MVRNAALFLALTLATACPGQDAPRPSSKTPVKVEVPPPGSEPAKGKPTTKEEKDRQWRTFEAQLAEAENNVKQFRKLLDKQKHSWGHWDRVAGALMARARFTGNWDDYAEAQELLEKAFELAGSNAGPFQTRAQLNYTLHRMDRIDSDLEMVNKQKAGGAAVVATRMAFNANVAFQRGQYNLAREQYEKALSIKETSTVLAAMAIYAWRTGDFDTAEKHILKSLDIYKNKPTEPRAWRHLLLGLMDLDRGRYDEALVHYRDGESWMKGYWLLDEHIAEILTLQGKLEDAKALYRDIVERTNNPEFMDALAGIYAEQGQQQLADEYVRKARKRYEEQLAQFPEAAYGHALEHFLEFGEDAKQVVELAQKNHTLRPNAEAKILLAQAHLKAEDAKAAKKPIDQALATPWKSADLFLTAAEVYTALGNATKADELTRQALAINPKAKS